MSLLLDQKIEEMSLELDDFKTSKKLEKCDEFGMYTRAVSQTLRVLFLRANSY
jgi:hypothetical protein